MVICGGLEILAAGYILNEFNKDKIEQRERRKKRRDTGERPQNHSQPLSVDRRPRHRPSLAEQQPSNHQRFLQPPLQTPPRPISAPPIDPRPGGWQHQQVQQGPYRPPQNPPGHLSQPMNPYLQALQRDQNFPSHPAPWQVPMTGQPPQPSFHGLPGPGAWQHAHTFQPQNSRPNMQAPPNPAYLQRPNTFNVPHQQPILQPHIQVSNTFPVQKPSAKPPPQGPLFYVDSKTGKISQNMYPPGHPMARDHAGSNSDLSRELWGDDKYKRTIAGDIDTGLAWSRQDEEDMAYGKDHSDRRRRRRSRSYERTRDGRRDSDPSRY